MKRLSLIFVLAVFLVFSISAFGQEWHTANQATVTWHAVAGFQETDIIEYRVWLSNAITDHDKVNPVIVGITPELLYVITLNTEGRFFVGVQTIRKQQQGSEIVFLAESKIGWSDNPEIAADGNIFGLQYYLPPPHGVGLL